ncbi:hypothetical protein [Spiroplasma endosymbiont of Amphibalanus improvisus]|uniref:hypothetical protein n=1 Tax=Spiroplasma endosymbiont of Amphibalanus improvisus TaxID=3066327 RepID=UPI00313E892D
MSYYQSNHFIFTKHALHRIKERVTFEWDNEIELKRKIVEMAKYSSSIIPSNKPGIVFIELFGAVKNNHFYLVHDVKSNTIITGTVMTISKLLSQY